MAYKAKNNAFSTLAGSLTNSTTTITVQTGHGDRFPAIAAPDYTIVTLEDSSGNREIIKVTARTAASDTMTVVRGQEGTTARAWSAGDSIELRLTAALIEESFAHVEDPTAAHAASAIGVTATGNLAATNVQAALEELQADVDTREKSIHAATEKTTPVDADTVGVIDSAASNVLKKVTWANIKATLKAYFDTEYASTLSHVGDTSAAHAASAISYAGSAGLSATDVEAALDELDTEKAALTAVTGKQTAWIPAGAMTPRTTNGAAFTQVQLGTNGTVVAAFAFDTATSEYVQFTIRMPKGWDEGTVTFAPVWTANSTSTNGVAWVMRAKALANDATLDAAWGTGVTVTDNNTATAYQIHLASESGAVTIANASELELVVFELYRDVSNGSDTLAVDALLVGMNLYYTTDAANDA